MHSEPVDETLPPMSEWSRDMKLKWAKQRAREERWETRVGSMIQDMEALGAPLSQHTINTGMLVAMYDGERGINRWLDDIQ